MSQKLITNEVEMAASQSGDIANEACENIEDLREHTEDLYPNELLFIINPKSGTMQAVKYMPEIIDIFGKAGYRTTVTMTQKSGDATNYVIQYGSKYDHIVCSGGDGTLNEVIEGIIESGYKGTLGYIPVGSTNDFAVSIGLPTGILAAAEAAVGGVLKTIDVGKFNGRCFSYIASFGAFASTSYSVPQNIKNIFGHAAYLMRGAIDVLGIRAINAKFIMDEGTPDECVRSGEFLFGGVCNATRVGGVLKLDKLDMDMNDGLVEVLLIEPPKNVLELNNLVMSLLTSTFESNQVEVFKVKKVKVILEPGVHWTLDGEFEAGAEVNEIETVESAVTFMTKG